MIRLAFLLALIFGSVAHAQIGQIAYPDAATATSYKGPGDIVSGATAWYGLRAYNAAYALAGGNAVNVRRASDNTTQNIVVLPDGALNVSAAATFAGTDATASCTAATSKSLVCTGASSTPIANDPISGVGITQPAYIVSCGTFTAGAGTCTMNVAQTISVAETVTFQVALFVTEWFDQTIGARHLSQATAGNQPQLLPNCWNSLPCMVASLNTSIALNSSANFTPATGVVSFSFVARRDSYTTATGTAIVAETTGMNRIKTFSTAGQWEFQGGSSGNITTAASDSVFHSSSAVINGASSVANIDGTETTGTTTGNTTAAAITAVNGNASQIEYVSEAGFYDNISFTSGQRSSLCHNQYLYWGTASAC